MRLRNLPHASLAGGPIMLRKGWPHDPAKLRGKWPHDPANRQISLSGSGEGPRKETTEAYSTLTDRGEAGPAAGRRGCSSSHRIQYAESSHGCKSQSEQPRTTSATSGHRKADGREAQSPSTHSCDELTKQPMACLVRVDRTVAKDNKGQEGPIGVSHQSADNRDHHVPVHEKASDGADS
jgi:hypothetical protein